MFWMCVCLSVLSSFLHLLQEELNENKANKHARHFSTCTLPCFSSTHNYLLCLMTNVIVAQELDPALLLPYSAPPPPNYLFISQRTWSSLICRVSVLNLWTELFNMPMANSLFPVFLRQNYIIPPPLPITIAPFFINMAFFYFVSIIPMLTSSLSFLFLWICTVTNSVH